MQDGFICMRRQALFAVVVGLLAFSVAASAKGSLGKAKTDSNRANRRFDSAELLTFTRRSENRDAAVTMQPSYFTTSRVRDYDCSSAVPPCYTYCPSGDNVSFMPLGFNLQFPPIPVTFDGDNFAGGIYYPDYAGWVGTFDLYYMSVTLEGEYVGNEVSFTLTLAGYADYWPDWYILDSLTPFQCVYTVTGATCQDGTCTGNFSSDFSIQSVPGNCIYFSYQETASGDCVLGVETGTPVVLIHGINGSEASWGDLKSILEDRGWDCLYFSYSPSNGVDWDTPIPVVSGMLNDALSDWNEEFDFDTRGVNIVAHSMGGLIARYLISHPAEFEYATKVEKLITLGTPNYGAAAPLWLDILPDTEQLEQMEFGSEFLWNLRESWQQQAPASEVLCIIGSSNNYEDAHDGTVLLPSAGLLDLGYPACYIPSPHTGSNGMAFINNTGHPAFGPIQSFLEGELPPSNVSSVSEHTKGMVLIRLVNPASQPVAVRTKLLGKPHVRWVPDPEAYWDEWWTGWPAALGLGLNSPSGIYYATGTNPGEYVVDIYPTGGYAPILGHPVTLPTRQAMTIQLEVSTANDGATETIEPGDAAPIAMGTTGVLLDFESGPGGEVSAFRFDDAPPQSDRSLLPHYWDIIAEMPDDSFEVAITFAYSEEEVVASAMSESNLAVFGYDTGWLELPTSVDSLSNQVTVVRSSILLFAIGGSSGPACGDADASGTVDLSDAIFLIQYIFAGGPAPVPLNVGDFDCSGVVDVSDVVYLIQYIFVGGPPPCDPSNDSRPDC